MSTALLTVNGAPTDVVDAVCRSILHDETFVERTLEYALLRAHAEKIGLANTDAELQLAADEMRYARGLESVEKLKQWMKGRGLNVLSIQQAIDGMLIRNKLRSRFEAREVEAWYAEHKLDLEKVRLYSIRVENAEKAKELLAQVNDEGADFHALAMAHSTDTTSKHLGGFVGDLGRGDVTGEIEALVFPPAAGKVVGPVMTEKGWNLFKVGAHIRPTLAEAESQVRDALLAQLVAKLRAESAVAWPLLDAAAQA